MFVRLLLLLLVLAPAPGFAEQEPVRPADSEGLTLQAFLQAVETAISTMDRNQWVELLSPAANRESALEFFEAMVPQGITRVVVKERDRSALAGSLPGEGYRLIIEVFQETGPRARIATWRLDIRRPRGDDIGAQPWRIVSEDRLASIEGLHRLALHAEKQFTARNLVLKSVDFELRIPSGDVFVAETPEGVTALSIVGDGMMSFQPGPKEERGQLRLFSGGESLDTPFTAAFIRINPFEFEQRVTDSMLEPVAMDARAFRRAQGVFDENVSKSFTLDLSDLSRDTWSLLPQGGDFVAEVRTRRFDQLTYARSSGEAEDVTLFQRGRKRNISTYASEQKLTSRGRFYNEDTLVDYDVLDYDIETSFYPDRQWMDGRTRMKLRVTSHALGVLTMKLAESLNVSSVMSDEFGRLLFLRVRNQNNVLVNLPTPVARDFEMTLTIAYSGRLERQRMQDESVEVDVERRASQPDDAQFMPSEPKWLFSNRNYWYPQAQVTDYATARVRVTVPAEFSVVGSGIPEAGSPTVAPLSTTDPKAGVRGLYTFNAPQPLRYLGILVSRMVRVDAVTVALDIVPPPAPPMDLRGASTLAQQITKAAAWAAAIPAVGTRNTVLLLMEANKRQEGRARDTVGTAADIIRLYAGLVGDVPYDAITVAMVEDELPGGHAPGYFAMINNPPPITAFSWRNDPAAFQGFPEFFIAHELAHQWFGQAVGWKNYHEQWLSEGFAQYFAALYARDRRGDGAFRDILRQFRRWAIEDSDQGPIHLGYRLGHIKGETRVFRALVYNKGAAVLHMLRRLVGDEPFFKGIRRFYAENRFKKAGTDDLRKAMEAESDRKLDRFFEQWIYDSTIPRLRFASSVEGQELVMRFEQIGEVFDVPVMVTVTYADGKSVDHLVPVTEATVERRVLLAGAVRSIEPNQDGGAVAVIERK